MGAIASQLGHPARVVLLDDDPTFADAVNAALYPHPDLTLVGHATSPAELKDLLEQLAPDAALIDHGLPRESGVAVAERVVKAFPGVWVLLLTDMPSRALWAEAMARGVRRIVVRPRATSRDEMARWADEELAEAIRDVMAEERRQLARIGDAAPGGDAAAGSPVAVSAPRVVTVWSPKGGTGKSTVATNLALWAQANPVHHVQTALVGLDAPSGTSNALLGLPPRPTLMDWLDYAGEDEIDPAAVRQRVAVHATGLFAVFEPEPRDVPNVSAALVRTVIRSLRAVCGLVVVDCEPSVMSTDAVGTALDMASVILLVVEPTVTCLKRVEGMVRALVDAQLLDPTKLRLVVNRMPPRPDLPVDEITNALGLQCIGIIPDDPKVRLATNRGRPPATHDPNGPFMRGLKVVAARSIPALAAASAGSAPTGAPARRRGFGLFARARV